MIIMKTIKTAICMLISMIPAISEASAVENERIIDFRGASKDAFVQAPDNRHVDLVLDRDTAIKIAETYLVYLYGESVLNQRPWRWIETGYKITIAGKIVENRWCGNAEITIRKSDGKVMHFTHTR